MHRGLGVAARPRRWRRTFPALCAALELGHEGVDRLGLGVLREVPREAGRGVAVAEAMQGERPRELEAGNVPRNRRLHLRESHLHTPPRTVRHPCPAGGSDTTGG